MKIIIVDRLNYSFGGTQQYVFSLAKLLKQKNHQVKIFNGIKLLNIKNAKKIPNKSPKWNALSKIQTIYSLSILIRSIRFFKKYKPDLIHLNNINYQITPSIIHSAVICKIPIVYTLHDYKLICAKYTLKNNQNSYCQSCNQQNFISIIKKKCTLKNQKSRFETLFLFLESIFHHKTLKIYKHIDCFISPSYFLKETFKKMGFKHSISVIPNFTYPPNTNVTPIKTNKQTKFKIIYFGRFVVEKGLLTLCKTIKEIPINLSLVGSGPLYKKLKSISKQTRNHPQRSENIKVYPFMKKTKLFNLI
ncbi:glycosyltransferase, partial [Patescibacteria group bacterium]|nr:glycosyltransferase [Patescibacteria group bacterium]